MRAWLSWTMLAVLAVTSGLATAQDRGRFGFAAGPSKILPFPYVYVGGGDRRRVGEEAVAVQLTADDRAGARRPAAWRYDFDPRCVAPSCLPSYWRPVYPPSRQYRVLLPLKAVVERLEKLDYRAYGAVLAGSNYQIEAINRHGRAMLLIVDARTGMIRRTLP